MSNTMHHYILISLQDHCMSFGYFPYPSSGANLSYSWWWVRRVPETCTVILQWNLDTGVASCWTFYVNIYRKRSTEPWTWNLNWRNDYLSLEDTDTSVFYIFEQDSLTAIDVEFSVGVFGFGFGFGWLSRLRTFWFVRPTTVTVRYSSFV
jgi:hypothetical protein